MANNNRGPAREHGFSFGGSVKCGLVMLSLPETLPDKPKPEQLKKAIAISVSAASRPRMSGTPTDSGSVEKKHFIELQLPGADLKPLIQLCSQATCGLDNQNVVSESHRRALKLASENFTCNFRLEDTNILAEIQQWAKPSPTEVAAHLIALNVYGPGDFFGQHKDSPMFEGHSFGTLVVVLPSQYSGGLLRVWDERGEFGVDHDWGRQLKGQDSGVQWAFIARDCWHEVQKVTRGHRLTLTYSLESSESRAIANQLTMRGMCFDVSYQPGRHRIGPRVRTFVPQILPASGESPAHALARAARYCCW